MISLHNKLIEIIFYNHNKINRKKNKKTHNYKHKKKKTHFQNTNNKKIKNHLTNPQLDYFFVSTHLILWKSKKHDFS